MIEIDRDTLRDFERAASLEWLETNGLGGWAGSTLAGAHSRRDHHLLRLCEAAAAGPAAAASGSVLPGATVALSKLDELVIENGRVHDLSCNRFPFFVATAGVRHLAAFHRDLFPVFEYQAEGYRLQKTIAALPEATESAESSESAGSGGGTKGGGAAKGAGAAPGSGALLVLYEVLEAPGPFVLGLRPFFARREPNALCRAGLHGAAPAALRESAGLRLRWPSGAEIFLAAAAELEERPDWWYRFELEEERRRGLDFQEDLWTPGLLRRELAAGDRFGLVVSAGGDGGAGRAGGAAVMGTGDVLELLARERRRREQLLDRLPVKDELTRILALAADQFPLRRSPPGAGARLLAAGYPGGEEATADSLIALSGVLLAAGRGDEARKLLRACARAAAGGTLPDRVPAGGEAGLETDSGSPDAPLWLFVAAWRYLQATGDEALVRDTLLPALVKIAAGHERGAPSGLRAAEDGLLEAAPGSPAAALRPGKAVELNALWHNALATLAELSRRWGDATQAKAWSQRARRVQRRYTELFWNAGEGCLHDSVGGKTPLRAHQVLAIGLPFPALSKQRGQRLLRTLEDRLYTPVGLRDLALSAAAPAATGAAEAAIGTRRHEEDRRPGSACEGRSDLAWPWLLGPLLSAQVWLRGDAGRRQALQLVAELDPLLASGTIGTIAELVGVEPPHAPAGHAAHAASVGELLRVYVEELHPATPTKGRRQLESKPKAKPKPGRAAASRPASSRGRGRKTPLGNPPRQG